MSVQMQIDGAGEFLKLRTNAVKLDNEIKAVVRKVAREARQKLLTELSRPGTGRYYGAAGEAKRKRFFSRTRSRPAYRASAPGRPPARMSGNLINSVRTKFPRNGNGFAAKVFAHRGIAFYRHFLEAGAGPAKRGRRKGAGGIRAPRPVFTPLQKQVENDLQQAVEKAIGNFVSFA